MGYAHVNSVQPIGYPISQHTHSGLSWPAESFVCAVSVSATPRETRIPAHWLSSLRGVAQSFRARPGFPAFAACPSSLLYPSSPPIPAGVGHSFGSVGWIAAPGEAGAAPAFRATMTANGSPPCALGERAAPFAVRLSRTIGVGHVRIASTSVVPA